MQPNHNARGALGKTSEKILSELGMEVVREVEKNPLPTPIDPDTPEMRAAMAIPAIVEILQDVDREFYDEVFGAVVRLMRVRKHDKPIERWDVEKPIVEKPKSKRWWRKS